MDFPPDNSNYLPPSEQTARQLGDGPWKGYLKNLGVWIGKRALSNSRGKVLIDLPNRVTAKLYKTSDGEEFVLWRTAVRTEAGIDEVEEEWSRNELADFAAPAADGSFSVGAEVFFGEPITVDQCLFDDRFRVRVRTTHAFDWEGCLSGVVASRERFVPNDGKTTEKNLGLTFVEPAAWRNPRVLFDYLLGLWEGTGITINSRTGETHRLTSRLRFGQSPDGRVNESSILRIGDGGPTRVFEGTGRLENNLLIYTEANIHIILLPGGVYVSSPIRIRRGRPFTLESAFLMRPDWRKRVLRLYNRDCEWVNTVFLNERRVG